MLRNVLSGDSRDCHATTAHFDCRRRTLHPTDARNRAHPQRIPRDHSAERGGGARSCCRGPYRCCEMCSPEIPATAMPQPHILIADDERSIRLMLETGLTLNGFHVTTARSGGGALEAVAAGLIDAAKCALRRFPRLPCHNRTF